MKQLFLSLSIICLSLLSTTAQTTYEVPQNVVLKTPEDYTKYEQSIVGAAKWLEDTDLNKELDKRKAINAFVLQWVGGSPTVSVELNKTLMDAYGKNVQLLGVYLASYSSFCIQNKSVTDKLPAIKASILSMVKVYKKGIDIVKSDEMEKIIKLVNENKLDEYIKKNFKI